MPFLQILWDPDRVDTRRLEKVRDLLAVETAVTLTQEDPEHVVTQAMVDCRVVALGPLDRVRSAIFVTLLARDEPHRRESQGRMAAALAEVATVAAGVEVVVEIVLTIHASSFEYAALEPASHSVTP